jgi:hypothetical protein
MSLSAVLREARRAAAATAEPVTALVRAARLVRWCPLGGSPARGVRAAAERVFVGRRGSAAVPWELGEPDTADGTEGCPNRSGGVLGGAAACGGDGECAGGDRGVYGEPCP